MGAATAASGQRLRNFVIAVVAILISLALFSALRNSNHPLTLAEQAEHATPWEEAQVNGKPTLLEFYANWCSTCRSMAKDLGELKAQYRDRVNFVMLNVDNTKWLPEIERFNVDGIPHFVFLNRQLEPQAVAIGHQPKEVMAQNLEALANNLPLPYGQLTGEMSQLPSPLARQRSDDPRSHGG
ncbi:MAG: thioredoxin family protein [Thermosynechococcus sp.]|uniref:thioredoxin family protein n=1 Tax=Thermosynechococcus sp. TaxID=2814275 RepID=UPI00391A6439